jgi:heat shock protein HtpX
MIHTSGRPAWYKPDVGLMSRMVLTMALLGGVYVAFLVFLGYALRVSLPVLIVIAAVLAFVQFFFSDKIALASMSAKEVSEAEAPQVHEMVGRLAAQANLPKPRVFIVQSNIPNAFATGRSKNNAVIAFTTAILDGRLDQPQLEAVIAHELTHVLNRDMLVMTVATFLSMVASLIVNNFFYIMLMGGGNRRGGRNDNGGSVLMLVYLVSIVVYAISFLLIRALSRYRELAADRGSALITGAPQHLATALMTITNSLQSGRIPKDDFRKAEGVNALFIVPALTGDSIANIFSSHPSIEERVERLNEMQRQMESAKFLG